MPVIEHASKLAQYYLSLSVNKTFRLPGISRWRRWQDRQRFRRLVLQAREDLKFDLDDLSQVRLQKHVDRFFHGRLGEIGRGVILDGGHWVYCPLLYLLCRRLRPNAVLETGVWWGFSSTFVLQALEDNGRGILYSIDLPHALYQTKREGRQVSITESFPPSAETGWLVPRDLRHRWKLLTGSSREKLPGLLQSLGQIDLFFHDSEHTRDNMKFEMRSAWQGLRKGGVLVVDNADWGDNAFVELAEEMGRTPSYYYDQVGDPRECVGIVTK